MTFRQTDDDIGEEHKFSLGWIEGEKVGCHLVKNGRNSVLKMVNSKGKVFRKEICE